MYARVASWEGGDPDAIRATAEEIQAQGESGRPAGVPAIGFMLLVGTGDGHALGITLFETEDDLRQGDATLNEMRPRSEGMGRRESVRMYEVAAEVRIT